MKKKFSVAQLLIEQDYEKEKLNKEKEYMNNEKE